MYQNLKVILKKANLEKLLPLFTNQNVLDSTLKDLCDSCLIKLGVEKMGDRKRLLSEFSHAEDEEASGGSFMAVIGGGTLPHDSLLAGQSVAPFLISKYPVMLAEWERVKFWSLGNGYELKSGEAAGHNGPIVMVSWYDTLKWCNAKSESLSLTPCYSMDGEIYRSDAFKGEPLHEVSWDKKANGWRLPTEAEWEWAARSHVCSVDDVFSERQKLNAAIGLQNDLPKISVPIGNNRKDEMEAYELPNNLWEWCWDLEDNSSGFHCIRGGCWNYGMNGGIEKLRVSRSPNTVNNVVGFRLARNSRD
jgi:formylglycine-generating enzyme required for sulfatase activity